MYPSYICVGVINHLDIKQLGAKKKKKLFGLQFQVAVCHFEEVKAGIQWANHFTPVKRKESINTSMLAWFCHQFVPPIYYSGCPSYYLVVFTMCWVVICQQPTKTFPPTHPFRQAWFTSFLFKTFYPRDSGLWQFDN